MNRLAFAALALAAGLAYGIGGDYALGFGPFNTASNSDYVATFGHSAGYAGTGLGFSTLVGTFAGARGNGNTACVGLGYAALYGARNCDNCIAIGANAGRGWQGGFGWVQIGNALLYKDYYLSLAGDGGFTLGHALTYTNGMVKVGYALIAARSGNGYTIYDGAVVEGDGNRVENMAHAEGQDNYVSTDGHGSHVEGASATATNNTSFVYSGVPRFAAVNIRAPVYKGQVYAYRGDTYVAITNGYPFPCFIEPDNPHVDRAWGEWFAPTNIPDAYYGSHGPGSFNINPLGGENGFWIGEATFADRVDAHIVGHQGALRFESGGLAVYTNGVKAGTLTFTPANQ